MSHCHSNPFKRINQDHGTKRDGWQSVACLGLWKMIKIAARASDAFVFPHNARKMGDIRNLSRKDMSRHQFPLMDTPTEPFSSRPISLIPANLPAHSNRLQPLPSLPHPFLPATHKFPTTPPTFSSIRPPLPSLPSILHHLHSIPNSTLLRNPASFQAAHRSPPSCPRSPGPRPPCP